MVATLAHGYFLPTDKYAQRVEHVANAGFVLSDLAVDDTGNFTVEVSLLDGNDDYLSYRNAVQLQVGGEVVVVVVGWKGVGGVELLVLLVVVVMVGGGGGG